jgi:DNA repair protein RadA/Sms
MVDTVLYFEGERGHQFRILRAHKNRFGPADEIGVFEMTGGGLSEVANPSALFLSERGQPTPGSAVFAGIEGTRPVLTEIQALVAPSTLASPRRTVVGLDSGRVSPSLPCWRRAAAFPLRAGRFSECRRAGCGCMNRPRIWPLPPPCSARARTVALPADTVTFRRNQPVWGASSGRSGRKQVERSAETWFFTGHHACGQKIEGVAGCGWTASSDLTSFVGETFGAG